MAPIFGDMSQSECCFEIKPPLIVTLCFVFTLGLLALMIELKAMDYVRQNEIHCVAYLNTVCL